MIVFSRKKNESLVIGHDISVSIVDIRDGRVRLGNEVPRDVSVHRGEVYEAILRDQYRRSARDPSS
jgi:carbon storage regulator